MCTSIERSKASSGWPLSASMIWSRDSTRPGLCASTTSRSNWWPVRSQALAVEAGDARAEVDLEAAEAQHLVAGRLRRGAAQQRLDARQQLARLERLGQVVVGAELEADDAVHRLAARGEHQQRQVARARVGAQLAAEVEAVAVGQHQVEHQRVVAARGAAARGRRPASRRSSTSKPARPQVVADHRGEAGVVVDQQQAWRHRAMDESPGAERPRRSAASRTMAPRDVIAARRASRSMRCMRSSMRAWRSLHALAELRALLGREHAG